MEFFDKLGKTASDTYKFTAEKTTKIAKETKLKFLMSEDKSKIEDIYEEIGKKVYEKHVRGEQVDIQMDLMAECSQIDALAEDIEDARKELLKLKDRKQCKKCFVEIDRMYHYCPNCGAEQNGEYKKQQKDVVEELKNNPVREEKKEEADIVIENLEKELEEESQNIPIEEE